MGQEPEAIREDIEATRERMGDTVDALSYKADVKSRAKENISGKIDRVKGTVTGKASQAGDAAPSGEDVKQTAQRAAGLAQENPLGLAVGAAAVGFLGGLLVPATSVENEKLGPMADQFKEQAKQTGQETLERGKQVAQDAAQSAAETAKESGQHHAEELKSSAQDSAEEVKQTAAS